MQIQLQSHQAKKSGYIIGISLGLLAFITPWFPRLEHLKAIGPPNTGHQKLRCKHCHLPNKDLFVRHKKVTTHTCTTCHKRKNDPHDISIFKKPKHAKIRKLLAPHQCSSCHQQHKGIRVTAKIDFCRHCHQKLKVDGDLIDIPHHTLTKQGRWNTCLGCHDYHRNHIRRSPKEVKEALPPNTIHNYFQGAPSPYSERKISKAKTPKK